MVHSLLLKKGSSRLLESIAESTKYVDIDYDIGAALDRTFTTRTRSLIPRDEYAMTNAYRIWLQSRYYDYIRQPGLGGFFDNALNDRFKFCPESEPGVKDALMNESALKWPEIEVLNIDVRCDMPGRKWIVKVTIRDKRSGMTSTALHDGPVEIPEATSITQ